MLEVKWSSGTKSISLKSLFSAVFLLLMVAIDIRLFWSTTFALSPDYATHNAWIREILDSGYMSIGYPPLAYWLAALVSVYTGSTIISMNVIVITCLVLSIACLLYLAGQAGAINSMMTVAIFAICYVGIKGLPILGYEVINNYFFSELVSTTYMLFGLVAFFRIEADLSQRVFLCLVFLGVGFFIYPIPILVFFGATTILMFFEISESKKRNYWILMFYIIASAALFITNISTPAILAVAKHNGGLSFPLLTKTPFDLGTAGILYICLSLGGSLTAIVLRLLRRRTIFDSKVFHLLNAVTFSASGLSFLQFFLYLFGLSNPYAVKKYFFILGTVLLVELIYLLSVAIGYIFHILAKRLIDSNSITWPTLLSPLLVMLLFSTSHGINENDLLRYDKDARFYYDHISSALQERNVIALYPTYRTFNYLITAASLRMPWDKAAKYYFESAMEGFDGYVITSRDNFRGRAMYASLVSEVVLLKDYVFFKRKLGPGETIVFSDASLSNEASLREILRSGFSGPEEKWGVWSDAQTSEMVIGIENVANSDLVFRVRPFLPKPGSSLTVDIYSGDEQVGTWTFSHDRILEKAKLKIRKDLVDKEGLLHLNFKYSQTTAPRDVGINQDTRELALCFVDVSRR